MTTDPLYLRDAYARTFDASIVGVEGDAVALDRTLFYPTGGGQPSDTGALSAGGMTWAVSEVRRDGASIWHRLEGASAPDTGTRVKGEVDWDRRHALMRTHTALHVLCGVIYRDYGSSVTGSNMTPLAARMDFELESMSIDFAEQIERRANAELTADHPISISFMPREEADHHPELIRTKVNLLPPTIREVRVVAIEGLDIQADGGTHVASTGEVGRIRVVGHESKGRINKRLRIVVEDA